MGTGEESLLVGQPHRLPRFLIRQPVRSPHNSKMGHPPRIPIWLGWEQRVIYFVTMCVENREAVLANDAALTAFRNAAIRLRDWTVLAAVLMPDHLHVLVSPTEDREAQLGNLAGAIKRWMRQELCASWRWQRGSFDRLLRSDESLHDKWLYVEENPVRAGLVEHYLAWPYRYTFNDKL